jgi:hypothetical protein
MQQEATNAVEAFYKLQQYIEAENYHGYDPYDALKSPLVNVPFLRSSKLLRFGLQQLVKRSPLNLRPILLIKKGLNPVTLGLCIQAYTIMAEKNLLSKGELEKKCNPLISKLIEMIPAGFHGACWGYDFDWESRYAKIPAFQPTIVATGFITNALFKYYCFTKNASVGDLCKSASLFVLNDIKRTQYEDGTFCFSYSPFDTQQVFNASMKGVRLLSQVYSMTQDEKLLRPAKLAATYVANQQQVDGSWKYAAMNKGEWIDNYHTGYVLDCFHEFQICTKDNSFSKHIENGFKYYLNTFFENNEIPKFFSNKTFPVDCTAAGQSILTLTRFDQTEIATNVARYMIRTMQDSKGYFYFRKYAQFTEKPSFMRWSNAWMLVALASLLPPKN